MNQGAVPSFRSKYCPPRYPMPMATAISRPTAPVVAAIAHIFFASGSMESWLAPKSSEPTADGQEGHLVVGFAQARRQGAHEAPQKVVGEIAIDKQEIRDALFGENE